MLTNPKGNFISIRPVLTLAMTIATVHFAVAVTAAPATLVVEVDKPGIKVSPMLYGVFFEDINCSVDGGIYAEQIRNRSLEDSDKPKRWSLVKGDGAEVEMSVDTSKPLSKKNPQSLKVRVTKPGNHRAGVQNGGFWGISVIKGAAYKLSLSARASEGSPGPLTISLESGEGAIYAQEKIAGLGDGWTTHKATLISNETDPKARLVISVTQPGTFWLDMVSLFPEATWKGHTNGLRPDLVEMLTGLTPAFVRFPGGCWVEGKTMKSAYRWKETIGDISERRTQYNIWGYQATHSIGYHEYLQMCEDLGAEPLFVINCGMSHQDVVPMDQMGEFVQDALDAVEYAKGPVTSEWGAIRAKNGHPAPFDLKYMEIGNENDGPAYQKRYALFHDALKAKHPEIKLVANVRTSTRGTDIVDEHYYKSPEFFIANANKYDSYDRNGPKIYVGEYAVTVDEEAGEDADTASCGQGNLRGALAEAAFMIGMERNSDVVMMATYAPLFANLNCKKVNPDLINFDSSRVYGTPSYYVQKLFAQNRPDVILPVQVAVANTVPKASAQQCPLHAVAGSKGTKGDLVLKVVNVSGEPQATHVRFQGVKAFQSEAEAVVLTSPDPADENSLENPTKVAPVTRVIMAGNEFEYQFPANSLTVLRLKAEK